MSTLVKKVSLSLILSTMATIALANPGQSHGEREAGRAVRQQQDGAEKNWPQTGRTFQYPEYDASPEEGHKKQNKLSPEERRALRRQINEAGQDLYVRKP